MGPPCNEMACEDKAAACTACTQQHCKLWVVIRDQSRACTLQHAERSSARSRQRLHQEKGPHLQRGCCCGRSSCSLALRSPPQPPSRTCEDAQDHLKGVGAAATACVVLLSMQPLPPGDYRHAWLKTHMLQTCALDRCHGPTCPPYSRVQPN